MSCPRVSPSDLVKLRRIANKAGPLIAANNIPKLNELYATLPKALLLLQPKVGGGKAQSVLAFFKRVVRCFGRETANVVHPYSPPQSSNSSTPANVVHPHSRSQSSNSSTPANVVHPHSQIMPMTLSTAINTAIMQVTKEDPTEYEELAEYRLKRLYRHLNSNFPANLNAPFNIRNIYGVKRLTSPLVIAVSNGYDDIVLKLLEAGVDINSSIINIPTALEAAAAAHIQIKMERLLLNRGADPTALEAAAAHIQIKMVRLLLNRGADPNVRSRYESSDGDIDAPSALMYSSEHDVEITRLLLEHGADPNATCERNTGNTALMGAVENNAEDVVKVLLKHGADPNAALADGRTALIIAVGSIPTKIPVIKLLLKHGAKLDNICGNNKLACVKSDEAMVILLNAGCNIPSYNEDEQGTRYLCRLLDRSSGINVKFSGKTLTNIVRVGKGNAGILHSYLNAFLRAESAKLEAAGASDIKSLIISKTHLRSAAAKIMVDTYYNDVHIKHLRRMDTFLKRVETILDSEADISMSSKSVSGNVHPAFKTIGKFRIKFKQMTDTYFRKAFPEGFRR